MSSFEEARFGGGACSGGCLLLPETLRLSFTRARCGGGSRMTGARSRPCGDGGKNR